MKKTNENLDGKNLVDHFDSNLASFAQKNGQSRGRKVQEPSDPFRLNFQRDRDRIIHTTSFRRLQGKTQVVPAGFGDHFRNRLTHTIEVSLVARDLARQLNLNEDLAETVALAHDLGHPPFGHAGERALNKKMQACGKHFDHNEQSLRVVEFFETRYPDFQGLNLSFEVLEGIQKHERSFDRGETKIIWPHLEAQLVDISDEIAYLSADLEDGLRANFFSIEDLKSLSLCHDIIKKLPENQKNHRPTFIRKIIQILLNQVVLDSQEKIKKFKIKNLKDVQVSKTFIIGFNADFYKKFIEIKKFLLENFYMHPKIKFEMEKGSQYIFETFDFLKKYPENIPEKFHPEENLDQRICDYIAGMTDNYIREFAEKIK